MTTTDTVIHNERDEVLRLFTTIAKDLQVWDGLRPDEKAHGFARLQELRDLLNMIDRQVREGIR